MAGERTSSAELRSTLFPFRSLCDRLLGSGCPLPFVFAAPFITLVISGDREALLRPAVLSLLLVFLEVGEGESGGGGDVS